MKEFDQDDYIKRLIPYRMYAIDCLNWVARNYHKWDSSQETTVFVNGEKIITGNPNLFINPIIEVGVIHCRSLLNFLGLTTDKEKCHLKVKESARLTDIVISNFSIGNKPLPKVTVEEALSPYKGNKPEAEAALVSVIEKSDTFVAHITTGPKMNREDLNYVEIASREVPALLCQYFYNRLGLDHPDYKVKHERRQNDS